MRKWFVPTVIALIAGFGAGSYRPMQQTNVPADYFKHNIIGLEKDCGCSRE